jgi:hypothetical protein
VSKPVAFAIAAIEEIADGIFMKCTIPSPAFNTTTPFSNFPTFPTFRPSHTPPLLSIMGANDSGKELKEPPPIVYTSKEGLYPIVSGDELPGARLMS